MSGDGGASEKTEEPTHKRLEDSRKKGDVPHSQDLSKLFLIAALGICLELTIKQILGYILELLYFCGNAVTLDFDDALSMGSEIVIRALAFSLLPILLALVIAGIMGEVMQNGFIIAPEKLALSGQKLNIVANAKNLLSVKKLMELMFKLIYVSILGITFYIVLKTHLPSIVLLPLVTPANVLTFLGELTHEMLWIALIVLIFPIGADFLWQRFSHKKQLRMTKDEVQREYKEMEGDPHVKGHRKQMAMEIVQGGGAQAKQASAVVVNPIHYANAIFYKEGVTLLPILVAKGMGVEAKILVKMAKEAGIPVIENVMLARALYAQSHIDQYIPRHLLAAVAEILNTADMMRLSGETGENPTAH